MMVKIAPKLNQKVLLLSSIEKQNVKHALGIFHETTIAALQQYSRSTTYGLDFEKALSGQVALLCILLQVHFVSEAYEGKFLKQINLK